MIRSYETRLMIVSLGFIATFTAITALAIFNILFGAIVAALALLLMDKIAYKVDDWIANGTKKDKT